MIDVSTMLMGATPSSVAMFEIVARQVSNDMGVEVEPIREDAFAFVSSRGWFKVEKSLALGPG
jgi:hypothetical protein